MPDQPTQNTSPWPWKLAAIIVLAMVSTLYFDPDFMVDLGTRLISCL
jgi:hypothetical protein